MAIFLGVASFLHTQYNVAVLKKTAWTERKKREEKTGTHRGGGGFLKVL